MSILSFSFNLLQSFDYGLSDLIKILIYALVEGISEWLPISSTGHLILLNEVLPLNFEAKFYDLFLVIIQLAAILAVVWFYWEKIWPFRRNRRSGQVMLDNSVLKLWAKLIIASIPAGIIGVLFDDWFTAKFYNPIVIAIMLILVGFALWWIEGPRKAGQGISASAEISYLSAALIGCFQVVAAVFPGTSRSAACIIGALLLGLSRPLAAEFSFLMAIPAMAGASLLKILKLKYLPGFGELLLLAIACLGSFIISLLVIRELLDYVKKRSFKPFAYYRIGFGSILLLLYAVGVV
ncbi:MAG: undecaprenyl-diphosphate phosphatase [Eubacteriales bacterium]|nr:undecaprenyl-diphosphate phosphatase [Eubacteriales bacterium]